MVTFPNCKINLGLNITAKRPDGYHDIETVFYPIALKDALEVVSGGTATGLPVQFSYTGLPINGDEADNLCVKAYHLLKKHYPSIPPLHIHLHKAIPMGAGLGGGSADGAYTLRLLNEYCRLDLSKGQLAEFALELGSDCPFFIYNKPCFAKGRGEKMEELTLDLSGWQFLLIHPGIHVPTAWAFSQIKPGPSSKNIAAIIAEPVEQWKNSLINDFELPVSAKFPLISSIKETLYKEGAVYAAMTGSGSTLFGIFKKGFPLPLHAFGAYRVSIVN